ncbi:hypothetical protein P691DRAFT_570429 [Macrolepiota fuliginosa MF-IS2]|uniref:F-box domain-containing protein n=1 Tax=Macrolepiota fuliginosa MF-IS2 TaxID=1400762 RepID=A0A9P5XGX6_9AGAR|nr:hypothetical protein P691DRAFT_570429 [Macrolepiota fuliginosa MF-IS2]
MSPEEKEGLEVQMMEQRTTLRLEEKRQAREMVNSSIAETTRPVKVTLLDLPLEILAHILVHLPFTSVVICQVVNRHLQVLISGSAKLQYYIHLGIYGMVDNPLCDLPVSERLNRLLMGQQRWEELDHDYYRTIDASIVTDRRQSQYSTTALSVLCGGGVLRQVQIPSEADQEAEWKERTVPFLITPGRSVFDQDLEILIIAQPRTVYTNAAQPHTVHEVQVQLNRLSTGEPHPDVQRAISFEIRDGFEELWATVECVGDNLVLVLRDNMEGPELDNQVYVYVYNWKTGEQKMAISAPPNSYRFPLFLAMHTFLLPNGTTGELEYWQIPQSSSETTSGQPFFILSLPPLFSGNVFRRIMARAGPRPTSGLHAMSKPFYTDPHHAIVCLSVVVGPVDWAQGAVHFVIFVHRNSLVGYLDTFSTLISSDERPTPVPYDDWGPSACRWFSESTDDYVMGWIGGTFGQKHVPRPNGAAPLLLLNFNPIDVAKALVSGKHISGEKARGEGDQGVDKDGGWRDVGENQGQQYTEKDKEVSSHQAGTLGVSSDLFTQGRAIGPSPSEPQLWTRAVIRGLDPLNDPHRCFESTVYSSLPYTVCSSQGGYGFEHLNLDEDYILGTQVNENWHHMKQLHVLHYG